MAMEIFETVTLNAVTVATDGVAIDSSNYSDMTVWTNITANTTAVTVNIEASYDGSFAGEEIVLDTTTHSAVTGGFVYNNSAYHKYVRVTTTSQTGATVTVVVQGRRTSS